MRRILLSIAAAAVVIGILWFKSPVYAEKQAVEVETAAVSQVDMYNRVAAAGRIEQTVEKKVCAGSAMKITKVYVTDGDFVYKGQILFRAEKTSAAVSNSASSGLNYAASLLGIPEEQLTAAMSQYTDFAIPDTAGEAEETAEFDGNLESPIEGVITDLSVKEGDIIPSGAVCAIVSDLSKLQVRTKISEDSISKIKVGMPVNIEGEAFNDRLFTGIVTKIMPVAKQASSLTGDSNSYVEAIVSIQDKDTDLKPGYSANLWIFTSKRSGALAIPYEAITQDENNRENVFVYYEGRIYKRYIQTGFELDEMVEVSLGLSPGEVVVMNPSEDLKHGQRAYAADRGDKN